MTQVERKTPRSEWTPLEKRLDALVRMTESPTQGLRRVTGRIRLAQFIEKHGKEACDKMWERIR